MAEEHTLASYLVKIGFDTDKTSQDKMTSAVRTGAAQAKLLVDGFEAAVKGFANMVAKVADGLEDLFYASARTKTSVAHLQALEAAAERTGSSVGAASSSIENFARFLKTNPGGDQLARQFAGANTQIWKTLDGGQKLTAMIKGLAKQPFNVQDAYRQMFGIDYQFWLSVQDPEFEKHQKNFADMQRAAGLDPQEAAKNSAEFLNTMRNFQDQLLIIWQKIEGGVVHGGGEALKKLITWLGAHSAQIANAVIKLANALSKFVEEGLEKLIHDDDIEAWFKEFTGNVTKLADVFGKLADHVKSVYDFLSKISKLNDIANFFNPFGAVGKSIDAVHDLSEGKVPGGNDESQEPAGSDKRNWWQRQGWIPRALGGNQPEPRHHNRPGRHYVPQDFDPKASGTLKEQRARFAKELEDNPALREKVLTLAANENLDSKANVSVIESMMNRAAMAGTTLEAQARWYKLDHNGYYQRGNGPANLAAKRAMVEDSLKRALEGSNVSNYATGNASGDYVRGKLARGVYSGGLKSLYNGEYFVGEDRGRGYGAWLKATQDAEKQAGDRQPSPVVQQQGRGPMGLALPPDIDALIAAGKKAGFLPSEHTRGITQPTQSPFGNLDDTLKSFGRTPLGTPPARAPGDQSSMSNTLHQNTAVNFYGDVSSHEELGRKVARAQNNINADLLRNMQTNAVG